MVLSVEDLQLDVPDAVDETAAFVARAVVDDVLPPSFVRRLPTSEWEPCFATGVGTCQIVLGLCWMMCCRPSVRRLHVMIGSHALQQGLAVLEDPPSFVQHLPTCAELHSAQGAAFALGLC